MEEVLRSFFFTELRYLTYTLTCIIRKIQKINEYKLLYDVLISKEMKIKYLDS